MNQPGKSRFGIVVCIFLHQIHVVHVGHLLIIGRRSENWTLIFHAANASHTGSSAFRGGGLLGVGKRHGIFDD
jgi:hypothetical protein